MKSESNCLSKTEHGLNRFLQRLCWDDIDERYLRDLARRSREEDLQGMGLDNSGFRAGDRTTEALELTGSGEANLVARESMVVCGLGMITILLKEFGEATYCEPNHQDGDWLEAGTQIGRISGNRATILAAERSLLNFVQRLSGIATLTKRFVNALADGKVRLLDTRKTTPGHRALEKYAVATGGGWNHRFGLFDRLMIKDNHLAASQAADGNALSETVKKAKLAAPDLLVQVEVDRLDQIEPALEAGVDALLLDNFSLDDLKRGTNMIGSTAIIEASGGISLDNISRYKDIDLDFISTSAVVGRSTWCDVGLDWLA